MRVDVATQAGVVRDRDEIIIVKKYGVSCCCSKICESFSLVRHILGGTLGFLPFVVRGQRQTQVITPSSSPAWLNRLQEVVALAGGN